VAEAGEIININKNCRSDRKKHNMRKDLKTEKTWITFLGNDFEKVWHVVLDDETGEHLDFNESTINHCKTNFNFQFGISPTSQMMLGNAVIDNF
jgi:Rps23 Pro-64 3,4-dihydroxylase Tpa1-like proline 4-hydroxylase